MTNDFGRHYIVITKRLEILWCHIHCISNSQFPYSRPSVWTNATRQLWLRAVLPSTGTRCQSQYSQSDDLQHLASILSGHYCEEICDWENQAKDRLTPLQQCTSPIWLHHSGPPVAITETRITRGGGGGYTGHDGRRINLQVCSYIPVHIAFASCLYVTRIQVKITLLHIGLPNTQLHACTCVNHIAVA